MGLFDRLFRRAAAPSEAKASQFGSMMSTYMLGRPAWQKRAFDRVAKEAYQQNVVAYACVWMVSRAAAEVPLAIMQHTGKTVGAVQNTSLEAFLNRPNPVTDGSSFRQSNFADFLLAGEFFIEGVTLGGAVREAYRLQPDQVAPVPGPKGWPEEYVIRIAGQERRVASDPTKPGCPILHVRDYSPVDPWRGMSPVDPAAFAIDGHTGAVGWNKALIENGARPSGALVYTTKDGGGLDDTQYERVKRELDQSYTGAKNAGRPFLLEGGLDWREMSLSPKDMDFNEGKNSSARDIALAFGVPPQLLGIPGDNTFANYQEANKALYRQTVLPLVWQYCRALNWWLVPGYGTNLAIEPDIDDLPVFADERAVRWQRIEASTVMTVNEKREAIGLPSIGPAGDKILVQSTMIPLESAALPMADTSEETDGSGDEESGTAEAEDDGDEQDDGEDDAAE